MAAKPLRYVIEREVSPGVWAEYKRVRRSERAAELRQQGKVWDMLRGIGPREYRIVRRRVDPK